MLNYFLFVSFFMFLVGFWVYISNRKHLMNMLISLEYMVLSLFLMILTISLSLGLEVFMLLVFLVASVCEGSLGVSMLVGIVRSHGSDEISSFSILKC